MVAIAEHHHRLHGVPLEPLSVFYGKEGAPEYWDLTPFPIGNQENGLPMPLWNDLSQWMKVAMATMMGNQFDLLTFDIHLHPDLEAAWSSEAVRPKLAERVRKELTAAVGKGREFFFVIESISKGTGLPTVLHMHGAVSAYHRREEDVLKIALARAAGHGLRGASNQPRAVHKKWFHTLGPAYPNYLFKFAKRFDARIDSRRLVMSHNMTGAARTIWFDITRPRLLSP